MDFTCVEPSFARLLVLPSTFFKAETSLFAAPSDTELDIFELEIKITSVSSDSPSGGGDPWRMLQPFDVVGGPLTGGCFFFSGLTFFTLSAHVRP